MSATTIIQLFVFLLAAFVGVQAISRVPPLLHTPLMAATNAMSGISLVASLVLAGSHDGIAATILGAAAVAFGAAQFPLLRKYWVDGDPAPSPEPPEPGF